jgi:hypothetical protein
MRKLDVKYSTTLPKNHNDLGIMEFGVAALGLLP